MEQSQVALPLAAAFKGYVRPSPISRLLDMARRQPLGVVATAMILAMMVLALFAPTLAPYDPIRILRAPGGMSEKPPFSAGERMANQPQGPMVVLGTDERGRDILSRIIWGTRVSLTVAVIAVVLGTGIGALVGLLSGFFGGATDMISQRIVDGLQAFPAILLALSIVAVLGPSTINIFMALAVIIWPNTARVIRSAVLSVKENMYIEAARAMGATPPRVIWQHILPNVMAPIIILASIQLGNAILIESSLSFLGLGTPPPEPSWGNMLGGVGTRNRLEGAPWIAIFPGLAISLAVYSFNLLGDSLRDVLDPRLRGR